MRYHFLDVSDIHEAVIRGDLAAAREAAQALTLMSVPRDTLPDGVSFVTGISAVAARVRDARNLAEAAAGVASMVRQCGECHQALRVRPTPPVVQRPDLGGLVGHMLEHQRAVDALLQGLIIPSATAWRDGVDRLKAAPLHPSYLLPDPRWTRFHRQADPRVHAIAERAQRASNPLTRGAAYADLLTTCADCHSLHDKLWGPGR
jgi:cytochrome c553